MKRNHLMFMALLLSVLMVFTSCSGNGPVDEDSSGATWSTFKKNNSNCDYPKKPDFTRMSSSELSRFRADMKNDPEGRNATVEIRDGKFNYMYGNMLLQQDSNGEWWGAASVNGEVVVTHLTNEWPDEKWAALLPGKPNLKLAGESVTELDSGEHQWMAMFVNMDGADIDAVVADYMGRLDRAGWTYNSDEYGEYYVKTINGRVTLLTFANIGMFYYLYVTVEGV